MFDALAGAMLVRAAPKIAPKAPCLGPQSGFPVCVPSWARPVLYTAACIGFISAGFTPFANPRPVVIAARAGLTRISIVGGSETKFKSLKLAPGCGLGTAIALGRPGKGKNGLNREENGPNGL